MAFVLPFGFDRADGSELPFQPYGSAGSAAIGTPTPDGAVVIQSSAGNGLIAIEEDPDSPTIERGEQCTAQHRFHMSWSAADIYIALLPRGLVAQDSYGNLWRVLTATIQPGRGGQAVLTVVSESMSFDSPPDDFQINTVDLGIDIIKHPRYFPNLYPTSAEFGTEVGYIKESLIRAIQTYRDSPFQPHFVNLAGLFNGVVQESVVGLAQGKKFAYFVPNPDYNPIIETINDLDGKGVATVQPANTKHLVHYYPSTTGQSSSVDLAIAATMEIITKLWRQEDSPYVAGIELKWSSYFFLPPMLNLGAYIEDPTAYIPDYFLKPDRMLTELPPVGGISYPSAGTDNIFTVNALLNPQCYSANGLADVDQLQLSALRKADEIDYQRTWFKKTRTWMVSVIGHWDDQIYGGWPRPRLTTDYQTF